MVNGVVRKVVVVYTVLLKNKGIRMRAFKNLLVTGGSGFIGSNFIRYVFEKTDFAGRIINLDALTYAGSPASLERVADHCSNIAVCLLEASEESLGVHEYVGALKKPGNQDFEAHRLLYKTKYALPE